MNEPKRLYRSRNDKMVSGLCAGLGEYTGVDPTIYRLLFALGAIFLFPTPILIYFVMMIVIPEEPAAGLTTQAPFAPPPPVSRPPEDIVEQ